MTPETPSDGQTDISWEEVKQYLAFAWWCVTQDIVTTIILVIGVIWIVAQIWSSI